MTVLPTSTWTQTNMRMKALVISCSILLLISINAFSTAEADAIEQGDQIIVVTPGTVARLCPYPNCGPDQHITRIPKDTVLEVTGVNEAKAGMMSVKWFEVTFNGKRGWISTYDVNKQ